MRILYQNLLTASARRSVAISVSFAGTLVVAFGLGAAEQTAVPGSMGLLVAIFAPDDMGKWPAVDVANAAYQRDIAWFLEAGSTEAGEAHEHGSAVGSAASSSKRCGQ